MSVTGVPETGSTERTVINEAPRGLLLESYWTTEEVDLSERIAEWYGGLTEAYQAELRYVEENIEPTLRRYSLGFNEA